MVEIENRLEKKCRHVYVRKVEKVRESENERLCERDVTESNKQGSLCKASVEDQKEAGAVQVPECVKSIGFPN